MVKENSVKQTHSIVVLMFRSRVFPLVQWNMLSFIENIKLLYKNITT